MTAPVRPVRGSGGPGPATVIDQVDIRCTCEIGYCDCCAGGIAAELAGRGYVEELLTDDDNGVWFRFTKRGEQ